MNSVTQDRNRNR